MIRKTLFWAVLVSFAAFASTKPVFALDAVSGLTEKPLVVACPINGSASPCSQPLYYYNSGEFSILSWLDSMSNYSSAPSNTLHTVKPPLNEVREPIPFPTPQPQGPLPLPTATPKPTPKATPLPVVINETLPSPSVLPIISSPTQNTSHPLDAEVLFTLVNDYRAQRGLPPFQKNDELCAIAQSRTPELYNEIFITGMMHSGLYNRNLPYWITENMIHMPTEASAFAWWLRSTIHRKAIESDYQYSCTACVGNSCAQLFTSFTPKLNQ